MPILLGPFDPIKLIFGIINILLSQNIISYDQARRLLRDAMNPNMPEAEKEKFLDSIIKRTDGNS